jgi:uncharacterized membrane protein
VGRRGARSGFTPWRAAALGLLGLATALAVWLTIGSLKPGGVPGCEAGDCATVLSSKWSKVFGVPVGLFGAASYGVLALLGAKPLGRSQRGARIVALALILLIPLAALWFASLQLIVLKAFCPWCSVTHALAVAGAVLMAIALQRDAAVHHAGSRRVPRYKAGPLWAAGGLWAGIAFAGFIAAQFLSPEPPKPRIVTASMEPAPMQLPIPAPAGSAQSETARDASVALPAATTLETNPESPKAPDEATAPGGKGTLSLHGGRFELDPGELPVLGAPDSAYWIVMISDYTCRYCRAASRVLHEVRDSFETGQLGIIVLPSHNGGDSMEIQRLMLAAWKIAPETWAALADDLYLERMPIQSGAVREALEKRLGMVPLQASLSVNAAWITNVFGMTKEIYAANRAMTRRGSIPQFIIGQEIVVGAPADAAEFFDLFAQHLGLVRQRLPELALAKAEIDLGRVFAGTQRLITLGFTNAGQASLELSRATLPPGGRLVRGTNVPILPGGTAAVEFTVAIPPREGPFEDTVTLHSNARTSATPVRITGVSWKPLTITPPLLDFGRLEAGSTSTQGVIRVEFAEDAAIESVRSQNPAFTAVVGEVTPGRAYDITVETAPDMPMGTQQAALLLALRQPVPEGWPESIAVGARALVQRAVMVVPPRVNLPAGPLSHERHHQVMVRCLDALADFRVTGAVLEGGPAFLIPEVRQGTGSDQYLVLFTLPAGWSAPQGARLVIETTHPRYQNVEVPLVTQ